MRTYDVDLTVKLQFRIATDAGSEEEAIARARNQFDAGEIDMWVANSIEITSATIAETPFLHIMHAQAKAQRRAEFEASEQMSLGTFTDALEAIPDLHQPIQFADGTHPKGFDSYRGFYDELALSSFDDPGAAVFADIVLERARAAVGTEFTGYKSGEYRMSRDTPLWAANHGETGSVAIVGVEDLPDRVGIVIHTQTFNR